MSLPGKVTDIHREKLYEYVGAIHIHSEFSDGSGSIPQIARIAVSEGLDFLLFTDHMTLEPLNSGLEGWYDRTLVLIGYEINDPDNGNHYLAFNLREVLPDGLSAPEYVKRVKEKGGIGFITHPNGVMSSLPEDPPLPWTEWHIKEFDGIEIWNYMSELVGRLSPWNIALTYLSPRRSLPSPSSATLERWDRLNRKRMVPGIGGVDAHAFLYKLGPFTFSIFPYSVQFRTIRTHILLDRPLTRDVEKCKTAIYNGLARARCFVSNFRWGDAKGFRFWAERSGGESVPERYQMGDTVVAPEGLTFHVESPQNAEIILLRNNVQVCSTFGRRLRFSCSIGGAYRIEVKRRNRSWIFSNHIRLIVTPIDQRNHISQLRVYIDTGLQ